MRAGYDITVQASSNNPYGGRDTRFNISPTMYERSPGSPGSALPPVGPRGMNYTYSFSLQFTHHMDIVYIAYSQPYTYSQGQMCVQGYLSDPRKSQHVHVKELCRTANSNRVELITITEGCKEHLAAPGSGSGTDSHSPRDEPRGEDRASAPPVGTVGFGAAGGLSPRGTEDVPAASTAYPAAGFPNPVSAAAEKDAPAFLLKIQVSLQNAAAGAGGPSGGAGAGHGGHSHSGVPVTTPVAGDNSAQNPSARQMVAKKVKFVGSREGEIV